MFKCKLTENVPEHTNEVAHGQHYSNNFESLEEIWNDQDGHDVVVIDVHVVFKVIISQNQILKFFLVNPLDLRHKLIAWQKVDTLAQSHDLDQLEKSLFIILTFIHPIERDLRQ